MNYSLALCICKCAIYLCLWFCCCCCHQNTTKMAWTASHSISSRFGCWYFNGRCCSASYSSCNYWCWLFNLRTSDKLTVWLGIYTTSSQSCKEFIKFTGGSSQSINGWSWAWHYCCMERSHHFTLFFQFLFHWETVEHLWRMAPKSSIRKTGRLILFRFVTWWNSVRLIQWFSIFFTWISWPVDVLTRALSLVRVQFSENGYISECFDADR